MEGKSGMEQARGGWVIELPELGSIKRSDVEKVKAYISRQDDTYRPAYGTVTEKHPRQCVFCGTTNETYFLKGDTGNRRFWVMAANPDLRKHEDVEADLLLERDQLWAEAVEYWRKGEKLYLPKHLELEARQKQAAYNDEADDPMKDMLIAYLDMKLPPDWTTWDLARRRAWFKNPDPLDADATDTRERVCVAEFLCERLGKDMSDKDYKYMARRVGRLMDDIPGWERISSTKHAIALYGIQKGFRRKVVIDEDDADI
jgi:hypothetical protein